MQNLFEPYTKTCLDTNRKRNAKKAYIMERSEYYIHTVYKALPVSTSGVPSPVWYPLGG